MKRLLRLLKFYLLTVVLFMAAKVVFMLCNHGMGAFGISDVVSVLWHGLSLDLSTALYFLIIPFLLTIVSVWVAVPRWVWTTYYALVAIVFSLAFVADTSLYPFWQFKLDASCLEYLATPTDAMASVSAGYLLLRVVAVVVVAVGILGLYGLFGGNGSNGSYGNDGSDGRKRRTLETVGYLLCVPPIVIGIRGGLDESTTNIGQVFYSQNQFLNHSAVNPVFSFLASMEKSSSDVVEYHFMDDATCQRLTDGLYNTASEQSPVLLTTQEPANIIVILLESMGGEFTEIGGRGDVTPRFGQLCREGIYFSNCYANSWRTDRGTLSTWSGYPSFPTMSVMKMPSRSRLLPNLARTLKEKRGYKTTYLYGGDINFTNMRSYLVAGGFEELIWKKDFSANEQRSAQWGVRDDITFNTLYEQITASEGNHLWGFSTLSSHEPWDVPLKKFDDEVLNAFFYLDQCIGQFVDRLKKTPVWQNTLIIMLPDHGINYKDIDQRTMLKNHIPMLWIGGVVKTPCVVDSLCNQSDLPATLLGQMGIGHEEFAYSRDVLSTTYTRPFAYNTWRNGYTIADSTGHVIYDLDGNSIIATEGNGTKTLEQLGKALLQQTSKELKSMR